MKTVPAIEAILVVARMLKGREDAGYGDEGMGSSFSCLCAEAAEKLGVPADEPCIGEAAERWHDEYMLALIDSGRYGDPKKERMKYLAAKANR